MRIIPTDLKQDQLFLEARIYPDRITGWEEKWVDRFTTTKENHIPLLTISVASVAPRRREYMTGEQVNLTSVSTPWQLLTISNDNSSTPRDPTYAVDQHNSTARQCLMNELTSYWKVNQKIRIFNIFDAYAFVGNTRLGNLSWNWFITHR